jgi:hypothetical protein
MKLYNKHLTSLADLKRERYLMKYAKQVHHADDLFSFDEPKGKKKKKASAVKGGSPLGMAASLLGLGPAAGTILGNKKVRNLLISRIPRKTISRVAWEVFGGYLKWKAIELSYGVVSGMIKKRREKKRIEQLNDAHHPVHKYNERSYRQSRGL